MKTSIQIQSDSITYITTGRPQLNRIPSEYFCDQRDQPIAYFL